MKCKIILQNQIKSPLHTVQHFPGLTLTYIGEVPVGGLNDEDLFPIGGDNGGWAVTLDDEAFVGCLVQGRREAVLGQHSHLCRHHTVLPVVVQLGGLWWWKRVRSYMCCMLQLPVKLESQTGPITNPTHTLQQT